MLAHYTKAVSALLLSLMLAALIMLTAPASAAGPVFASSQNELASAPQLAQYLPHKKQPDKKQPGKKQQRDKKQGISAAQAANIAKRSASGKVLKVSQQGGKYRVKLLLPSGRVKNIWVDAASGKVQPDR